MVATSSETLIRVAAKPLAWHIRCSTFRLTNSFLLLFKLSVGYSSSLEIDRRLAGRYFCLPKKLCFEFSANKKNPVEGVEGMFGGLLFDTLHLRKDLVDAAQDSTDRTLSSHVF